MIGLAAALVLRKESGQAPASRTRPLIQVSKKKLIYFFCILIAWLPYRLYRDYSAEGQLTAFSIVTTLVTIVVMTLVLLALYQYANPRDTGENS